MRDRAQELIDIVERAFAVDPELKESLEVYQLSQDEYYKALASTKVIKITSDSNTKFGGNQNDKLVRG